MSQTGAIILAAGSSSRLGQPKQLLSHVNGTLIEHVTSVASDVGCTPIVVITGAIDDPIRQRIGERATVAHNADWQMGMGSSIRVGLASLLQTAADTQRVLILLSDQPAISVELLKQLVENWKFLRRPMAACAYGGSVGPPCGFNRSQFDQLMQLPPDQGAKKLLHPREAIATIDWPDGLIDIDTPEDFQRWQSRGSHASTLGE